MRAAGGGGSNRAALRTFSLDQSVKDVKLQRGTFARILAFARPFRFLLSFFLLTVVIDALLTVASPLILKDLVDKGVIPKNGRVVLELAILVGVLAIVDAVTNLAGRYLSSRIGEGLIFEMRTQVFSHIQKQSIAFFTRTQTGALISRINSDVMGAQTAFTDTLSGALSNFLVLLLVSGAMFALSWQITLISLALLPLFLIPSKRIGQKIAELTRNSFGLNAEMSSMMSERFNVSGALLVMLYGKSNLESNRFSSRARKVADIGVERAVLNRIFSLSIITVASLATAIAYGVGGHLAITGVITVGSLLALTTLLARLYGPITSLSNIRVDVMSALVSFERVFEVLDLEPMVKNAEVLVEFPSQAPSLTFKNVEFSYPKAHEISLASLEGTAKSELVDTGMILRGISFDVPAGSFTAIVGSSGAGKSTISALIPRLYDVTAGEILINEIDIRSFDIDDLRSSIGVVTQDSHMFHESIGENLRYANPSATFEDIERACTSAQIWKFIQSLPNGLETIVGERGHRLSGGEKQRLAIARLLLKDPSIVILDEATAHLDSENEALVQQALEGALQGRTSIVIAHRLSTVQNANQIIVLDSGIIAERGTHAELVALRGIYHDLYQRQLLSV